MAIYDASSGSSLQSAAISSYSWNHTCSGGERVLLVQVITKDGGGVDEGLTVTGITYNSVAMTLVRSDDDGAGTELVVYRLINPAQGANSIEVTLSGTMNVGDTDISYGVAVSATGVNQTSPVNVSAVGSGVASPMTTDITTTIDNCLVIDFMYFYGTAATVGSGQTSAINTDLLSSTIWALSSYEAKTTAGTVTMSWTSATPIAYYHQLVALSPSSRRVSSPSVGGAQIY